jgi:hypothetical protein
MECSDELRLLDEAGLEGDEAEEQMAIGCHGARRSISDEGRQLRQSAAARSRLI